MKHKNKFYWFDVFGIILYYIPSYYLYALVYDLSHQTAHWGSKFTLDYGRNPVIHLGMFLITFTMFTILLLKMRHGKDKASNNDIIVKRIIFGIIWTFVFIPFVFLINSVNNAW